MKKVFSSLSLIFFLSVALAKQPLQPFQLNSKSALGTQKQKALTVSEVIAQVGSHVLTLREAEINSLVEETLFKTKIDGKEMGERLNGVVLEWIIFLEAQSFSTQRVSSAEVDRQVDEASAALASRDEWRGLEVSKSELQEMVKRKLVAKDFIQFKISSSQLPISDEDAQSYFQKNRGKFGTLPFESFKDNIKKFLAQQQSDRRLKDWFEILQKKHSIRVFVGSENH